MAMNTVLVVFVFSGHGVFIDRPFVLDVKRNPVPKIENKQPTVNLLQLFPTFVAFKAYQLKKKNSIDYNVTIVQIRPKSK